MSDDVEELPIIRPKLGGRSGSDRVATFSRSVLNKSARQSVKKGKGSSVRGGHPSRGKRAAATRKPAQFDRRAVIKARVVKMNNYGKKAMQLHIKYIERDGVEKDGSKGQLYGKDDSFDSNKFTREIEGEQHQFRFIVSPEDAGEMELTDYTRELMDRMEKDLGRPLEWGAVNHYNTDNPHTHIVVRGVDLDGKELRIDREYISNGMRNRACEISTEWLGQRTELDLENQAIKEIKQERFNNLDYQINKGVTRNTFDMREYQKNAPFWLADRHITARLDTLQKLGLAHKDGAYLWKMKEGWEDTLKAMGKRGDIIHNMYQKVGGDTDFYRIYDKSDKQQPVVEGKLVDKGLSDELYDKQYLVVNATDGHLYHVDLDGYQSIQDYRQGDVIKLETKQDSWLKPSDENIQEIASNSEGIYRPEEHIASIETDTVKVNGVEVSREDFVDAHVKRLHRLARYELATELENGAWQVSENLVDELQKRDEERPQRKLSMSTQSDMPLEQQQEYRGRTWLDKHTDSVSHGKLSQHGFGSEVGKAARIRANFLKKLGINPEEGNRARQLDKIQDADLAKNQASKTGRQSVPLQQGKPIRGTLTKLDALANGRRFSRIDSVDGKTFGLVPWHKSHEKLMGKQVQAGLTKVGRAWVKGLGLDMTR